MRAMGGEVGAAATLAPKVGPLGLSPKKVGEDIKEATKEWKGIKVTVKLIIQNRQAQVELVPSASSSILKALNEPVRDRKTGPKNIAHDGDISFDKIVEIARIMRPRSISRHLSGTIKEILGTAFSIGCTIDGNHPSDVQKMIDEGTMIIPAE